MGKYLLVIFVLLLFTACKPKVDKTVDIQLLFADSTCQLTGVAATRDGRIFTCYPLWSDIHKYSVAEVLPGNHIIPYPNDSMNNWKNGDSGINKWVCVQAVYADDANALWVVDPASPKQKAVYQNSQKLVKINLATNTVERIYPLAGTTDNQSYINDVRVDTRRGYAYLTNSTEGGIVIVDVNTGRARQVLQGSPSVMADPSYVFSIEGKEIKKNGVRFRSNSDGIALTPDGEWLYYKPLSDNKLYRISTSFLRDTTLTASQLGSKVEKLGAFAVTDGMVCDSAGNLYMGDIEHRRIIRIAPDTKMGNVTTIVKDDRLIWPDSYQIAKGFLYFSCSQINLQPEFNNGGNRRTTPYSIYKLRLPE